MEVANSRNVFPIVIKEEAGEEGGITGALNVVKKGKTFVSGGNETVTVQLIDTLYWDVSGHKRSNI
jgi:hypothetical protein